MKKLINSCIASFAMFSRIPMPKCDWERDNIRYMLVFMPLVGAVIGALSCLWAYLGSALSLGDTLFAVILFLIPFVLTGGIHLDGYLDTTDALSSWKPKEQRVEILKDVHVGAFAVIRGIVWFIFMYGLYSEVARQPVLWPALGFMFPMSRCLNALSIFRFPKAKETGTVNTWEKEGDPKCKWILPGIYIVCGVAVTVLSPLYGGVMTLTMLAVYYWYYRKAVKYFGGMTGDLAGYFVCVCEAAVLFVLVLVHALAALL